MFPQAGAAIKSKLSERDTEEVAQNASTKTEVS